MAQPDIICRHGISPNQSSGSLGINRKSDMLTHTGP